MYVSLAHLSDVASVDIVDGVAKATILANVFTDSQPLWSSFIVSNFIGDSPHIGKVHATVNLLRTNLEKTPRVNAQFLNPKTVLFRIDDTNIRSRVLHRHFWHIVDTPMVVQVWGPSTANHRPDLTSIPIWVDFKDVPDYLFMQKRLKFLGNLVGTFQKLHPNTEHCLCLDKA